MADGTIRIVIDSTGAVRGASEVNRSLGKINASVKTTRQNVVATNFSFKEFTRSLIGPLGFVAAAVGVVKIVRDTIRVNQQFQKTLSELSAITGASGKDLKFLSDQAKNLGRTTTLSASEVATGFKLIASAKPDLLESGEALTEVTKQAITLAEAAGTTLPAAASALGGALNQFQADSDEAGRFINVLAAGAKFGAAEIPDLTESLKNAGTVAAASNISFEQTIAAIEALAEVNLKGAESGTALRNILLILQKEGVDALNPKVVGLTQALRNLRDEQRSDIELIDLFGIRNISAAQALIARIDRTDELTDAITGTTTAEIQAIVNTDNLDGRLKNLSSAVEGLQLALAGGALPSLEDGVGLFAEWINVVTDATERTNAFANAVGEKLGGSYRTNEGVLESLQDASVATIDVQVAKQEELITALEKTRDTMSLLAVISPFAAVTGIASAIDRKAVKDAEIQLAKIQALREDALAADLKKPPPSPLDPEEAKRLAAEAKAREAAEAARKKLEAEALRDRERNAKQQESSFLRIRASLEPIEQATRDLTSAEEVLLKQRKLGKIGEDERLELSMKLKESFEEALDPLAALTEKLKEEVAVAKLTRDEQQIEVALRREITGLRKAGIQVSDEEVAALRASLEEIQTLNKARDDTKMQIKGVNEELELQQSILDQLRFPQLQVLENQKALNQLYDDGKISLAELNRESTKLDLQALEGLTSLEAGFERGFIKATQSVNDFASASEQLVTGAFQGAEDSIVSFVESGKVNFSGLVDSILSDLLRLSVKKGIAGALGASPGEGTSGTGILGLLAGLAGGGSSGGGTGGGSGGGPPGLSDGIVASLGAAFASNADGGIQRTPTISRLAEKGPEAIIPLKGGSVPVEIKDSQRPPINIQNTFNISTPNPDAFRRSRDQIGLFMGQGIQNAMARNG